MVTKKTTKKAPVKKRAKSTNAKQAKVSGTGRHAWLQPEDQPFITFQVTKQSLYWLILGAVMIIYTIWILQLQIDIQSVYDQIQMTLALT